MFPGCGMFALHAVVLMEEVVDTIVDTVLLRLNGRFVFVLRLIEDVILCISAPGNGCAEFGIKVDCECKSIFTPPVSSLKFMVSFVLLLFGSEEMAALQSFPFSFALNSCLMSCLLFSILTSLSTNLTVLLLHAVSFSCGKRTHFVPLLMPSSSNCSSFPLLWTSAIMVEDLIIDWLSFSHKLGLLLI